MNTIKKKNNNNNGFSIHLPYYYYDSDMMMLIIIITIIVRKSPQSPQWPQSPLMTLGSPPDPNPLISYHRHLSALINSTTSLHSSRSLHVWGLKYSMLTYLTHLTFCLLTSCSSVPIPVLHHSCAPSSPCSTVPSGSLGKGIKDINTQISP